MRKNKYVTASGSGKAILLCVIYLIFYIFYHDISYIIFNNNQLIYLDCSNGASSCNHPCNCVDAVLCVRKRASVITPSQSLFTRHDVTTVSP